MTPLLIALTMVITIFIQCYVNCFMVLFLILALERPCKILLFWFYKWKNKVKFQELDNISGYDRLNNSPPKISTLISSKCEYVILYGKEDTVDVIKLRIRRWWEAPKLSKQT